MVDNNHGYVIAHANHFYPMVNCEVTRIHIIILIPVKFNIGN